MFKTILTSAIAGFIMITTGYADVKVDVVQYSKPGGQATIRRQSKSLQVG